MLDSPKTVDGMARDWLKGVSDYYDVIVVGSGLAGLTGANCLAKNGHSVLLLEHHYQYGGLATWFRRQGGHIFDISLHGFPIGMIKSCRKYWTREIAESIVQLRNIRFINPQFNLWTTFDRVHFTNLLIGKFKVAREKVEAFFNRIRSMNFYDDTSQTTKDLFEEFFPGREDVHRLLMEPIAYANGSSLEDPAITFGIVFGNFMNKGVFTFRGGTDVLIKKMVAELKRNGVVLRKRALVEKVLVEERDGCRVAAGVKTNGRLIRSRAVLSNANIKSTILRLVGQENFEPEFVKETQSVRINNSSCQIYIGLKKGESIPDIGDLVFTSEAGKFSTEELTHSRTSSRTFSFYYPSIRPHLKEPRYAIVCSLNGKWNDWASLTERQYVERKDWLCEAAVSSLEKLIPGVRDKIEHLEASTPRTFNYYTRHLGGTSFGTKFEGLNVSMKLSEQVKGLFHAGSVGIIMSGWLGTINYGVIIAHRMDKLLSDLKRGVFHWADVNEQERGKKKTASLQTAP